MRRARMTWPGAYHHVMARGINGMEIFGSNRLKEHFLKNLTEQQKLLKIPIYAWCIMNNHYHLVLNNHDGRMSEFMKRVNGPFGQYFRFQSQSRGIVFQGRFRSLLIQNDAYLIQVIRYVLKNPVQAGLVEKMESYPWSSARVYFRMGKEATDATRFVETLFGNQRRLFQKNNDFSTPPMIKTRMGAFVGDEAFAEEALVKADKRKSEWSGEHRRRDDAYFQPVDVAAVEFRKKFGIYPSQINAEGLKGKRLRAQWLVRLRDYCNLTYTEIARMDLFADLKMYSLAAIYRNARARKS